MYLAWYSPLSPLQPRTEGNAATPVSHEMFFMRASLFGSLDFNSPKPCNNKECHSLSVYTFLYLCMYACVYLHVYKDNLCGCYMYKYIHTCKHDT